MGGIFRKHVGPNRFGLVDGITKGRAIASPNITEIKAQAIDVVSQGSVVSIAPACDPKTGLFPVEILINNTDGKLKPGMMTDVTLRLQ